MTATRTQDRPIKSLTLNSNGKETIRQPDVHLDIVVCSNPGEHPIRVDGLDSRGKPDAGLNFLYVFVVINRLEFAFLAVGLALAHYPRFRIDIEGLVGVVSRIVLEGEIEDAARNAVHSGFTDELCIRVTQVVFGDDSHVDKRFPLAWIVHVIAAGLYPEFRHLNRLFGVVEDEHSLRALEI